MRANLTYSAHRNSTGLKISQNRKLKIYERLTCPVLSYMAKAWTMMSEEMNALRAFKSKVLKKLYGPIK